MTIASLFSPFAIGRLMLPNRLIQGPLAGISAAPFRRLFYQFVPPAYTVSEMLSAQDVLTRHAVDSRYLYRAAEEERLCYQISGTCPEVMGRAALKLQHLGADLIDINCGCPKAKIRKKGAGSALMDKPLHLLQLVESIKKCIQIPLTVKLRIYGTDEDVVLAQLLEQAGVDALIIHGRRWTDSYDTACNYEHIGFIKQHLSIPVIANGDLGDEDALQNAIKKTNADAYMISRAGCGRPWLYQHLLQKKPIAADFSTCMDGFIQHLQYLSKLESEYQAVIQSRSFVRYYFRHFFNDKQRKAFYELTSVEAIVDYIQVTWKHRIAQNLAFSKITGKIP